ncbi:MAG: tRNA (adenosine(37)-N6)-dimethylallyltransferase MiaA [Anaerovoracaceae bacterium]
MKKIIVVAGPTAVGKTEYALKIAEEFNGEIVSCDSMQLYKYMDIGSAKPTGDQLSRVKHYLVDEVDPRDDFSVAKYEEKAKKAIKHIHDKGKMPVISGGTGLYLNAILYEMDFGTVPKQDEYRKALETLVLDQGKMAVYELLEKQDPQAAQRIHPNNTQKIIRALETVKATGKGMKPFTQVNTPVKDYEPILIGLTRDRKELYSRINLRVEQLMDQGLVSEVESLLDMGLTENHISMKGIGYKEIIDYLRGKYDLLTATEKIRQNTRNYAKRQLTWLRRYDTIKWFNLSDYDTEKQGFKEISLWLNQNK